jgi:glycerophosphoryl diester phosphodiesterase
MQLKLLPQSLGIILLMFIAGSSCTPALKNTAMLPAFDKQGHRGARGLSPENTIPSMYKAIDLGVNTIEVDVVITSDEKVLISHEAYFNHLITTKVDGSAVTANEEKGLNIYKMTFAETQQFDVGLKPYPAFARQEKIAVTKPLLGDLIDSVEAYTRRTGKPAIRYNIEVKSAPANDDVFHPVPTKFIDLVMQVVKDKKIAGRMNIQSFDYRPLRVVHTRYPGIRIALLVGNADRTVAEHITELGFTPEVYSPHYALVNPALVQQCRDMKMKLIPWTVNDKTTIERLKGLGVDGIITDYPDLF